MEDEAPEYDREALALQLTEAQRAEAQLPKTEPASKSNYERLNERSRWRKQRWNRNRVRKDWRVAPAPSSPQEDNQELRGIIGTVAELVRQRTARTRLPWPPPLAVAWLPWWLKPTRTPPTPFAGSPKTEQDVQPPPTQQTLGVLESGRKDRHDRPQRRRFGLRSRNAGL